jgi:DNA invertase Pin-like site-specific DNA recombinase
MATVYGYGRHSTEKQGDTEIVQREKVQGYYQGLLKAKGLAWGGWFYDAAVSGSKPFTERPDGLRLWMHLQPGDYVVVSALDRAFRSLLDGVRMIEMYRAKGVHFVAIDISLDTSTAMGEFGLHIFLAAAQLNRRLTSERTREVMAAKRERGERVGRDKASAPIGWMHSGSGWAPDNTERKQVDRMAEWRARGLSLARITARCTGPEFERRYGRKWTRRYVTLALRARVAGYPKYYLYKRRGKSPNLPALPAIGFSTCASHSHAPSPGS